MFLVYSFQELSCCQLLSIYFHLEISLFHTFFWTWSLRTLIAQLHENIIVSLENCYCNFKWIIHTIVQWMKLKALSSVFKSFCTPRAHRANFIVFWNLNYTRFVKCLMRKLPFSFFFAFVLCSIIHVYKYKRWLYSLTAANCFYAPKRRKRRRRENFVN